jgi:hypothetical protein
VCIHGPSVRKSNGAQRNKLGERGREHFAEVDLAIGTGVRSEKLVGQFADLGFTLLHSLRRHRHVEDLAVLMMQRWVDI